MKKLFLAATTFLITITLPAQKNVVLLNGGILKSYKTKKTSVPDQQFGFRRVQGDDPILVPYFAIGYEGEIAKNSSLVTGIGYSAKGYKRGRITSPTGPYIIRPNELIDLYTYYSKSNFTFLEIPVGFKHKMFKVRQLSVSAEVGAINQLFLKAGYKPFNIQEFNFPSSSVNGNRKGPYPVARTFKPKDYKANHLRYYNVAPYVSLDVTYSKKLLLFTISPVVQKSIKPTSTFSNDQEFADPRFEYYNERFYSVGVVFKAGYRF